MALAAFVGRRGPSVEITTSFPGRSASRTFGSQAFPTRTCQSLVAEIAELARGAHQRGDRVAGAQRAAKDLPPGSPVGAKQNDVHAHPFERLGARAA